jgi:hypothetical protein
MFALYSRRPDALRNPQFWAEDGTVWYAQAYNWGWLRAIAHTDGGYLQTLPRLAASFSLLFSLAHAPLVFNICGLVVQAAPALFLLSSRLRKVAKFPARCVLAAIYIAAPNMQEVHATIEYGQWHLAVLSFLVLISDPPESRRAQIFDVAVLLLCAVTGPFCILLLLPAIFVALACKRIWNYVHISLLCAGAALQGVCLLLNRGQRVHVPLHPSISAFCRIFGGHIVDSVLQGQNHVAHQLGIAIALTVVGVAAYAYALWKGPLALRGFVTFGILALVSSLFFAMAAANGTVWDSLVVHTGRYWMIPELAFIAVLVWSLSSARPVALRVAAAVLLCFMVVGIIKHWRYPALPDLHFQSYASNFEQLPAGAVMTIPLNPPGWSMTLEKRY